MYKTTKLILLIVGCFCLNSLSAQEDTKYLIETKKGSKFKGEILQKNEQELILSVDEIGEITILVDDIKLIREIKTWNNDALGNKNFWSPTAFAAKKNQSYYQNIGGLFNQLNYSVANNLSIGFGAVPILFGFQQSWPIWLMAKYTLPSKNENVHFAIGGIGGTMVASNTDPTIALGYGLMTLGNKKNNFTLGLAYGKYDGSVKKYPVTNLSANIYVKRPISILTENYILFDRDKELFSYSLVGLKFDWYRFQLDMGVVVTRNTGSPYAPFPLIGIAVPIGRG